MLRVHGTYQTPSALDRTPPHLLQGSFRDDATARFPVTKFDGPIHFPEGDGIDEQTRLMFLHGRTKVSGVLEGGGGERGIGGELESGEVFQGGDVAAGEEAVVAVVIVGRGEEEREDRRLVVQFTEGARDDRRLEWFLCSEGRVSAVSKERERERGREEATLTLDKAQKRHSC